MLNTENIQLDKLIVHQVGNKGQDEGVTIANESVNLNNPLVNDILLKYFLSPFKNMTFYQFAHENDLNMNEVYVYAKQIFEDYSTFEEQSAKIAKHLYETSTHPKIKSGEFYVVYLKDCLIEDEMADAIGLFKTENKETYLKVKRKDNSFEIGYDDGVNINRMEKGCLIFNTETENGMLVALVDALNKANEAQYWRDAFLNVKPRKDNYYNTKQAMDLCKEFIEVLKIEENKENTEIAELKNNAIQYFTESDNFEIEEFEKKVIKEPKAINAFREYKQNYESENNVQIKDDFEIADNAAKKAKAQFKSIIKLDTNFHLYIHGNRELIIKGFDKERNMNYYQVFFEEEK